MFAYLLLHYIYLLVLLHYIFCCINIYNVDYLVLSVY